MVMAGPYFGATGKMGSSCFFIWIMAQQPSCIQDTFFWKKVESEQIETSAADLSRPGNN